MSCPPYLSLPSLILCFPPLRKEPSETAETINFRQFVRVLAHFKRARGHEHEMNTKEKKIDCKQSCCLTLRRTSQFSICTLHIEMVLFFCWVCILSHPIVQGYAINTWNYNMSISHGCFENMPVLVIFWPIALFQLHCLPLHGGRAWLHLSSLFRLGYKIYYMLRKVKGKLGVSFHQSPA